MHYSCRHGLRDRPRSDAAALHRSQEIPLRDPAGQPDTALTTAHRRMRSSGGRCDEALSASAGTRGLLPVERRWLCSRRCSPCAGSALAVAAARTHRRRPPKRRPRNAPRRPGSPATGPRSGCAALVRSTRRSTAGGRAVPSRPRRNSPAPPPASSPSPPRTSPPYSVNGRIFIRQGEPHGYCSGTAINSPTRQLVLTAGPLRQQRPAKRATPGHLVRTTSSSSPPTTAASRPFGAFVARRNEIYAPKQWTKHGNPDFDLGAFLTRPNAEGVNVADAVGGGATIVTDLSRKQEFQTFGYPGESDAHAELHLALHRRRHPQLPAPRPADPRRSAATGRRAPAAAAG